MNKYSTLRLAIKLSLSTLCILASVLFALAASSLFSTPLTTEQMSLGLFRQKTMHQGKHCTESCRCSQSESCRCPQREECRCPQRESCRCPLREGFFDGLNNYVSYQLVVQSGRTPVIYPYPRALSFGSKVAGSGDEIISRFPTNDSFLLYPGDYKISAGVSTLGITGVQLEVSINRDQVFKWPNTPTALNDTTFLEFTLIREIEAPSILELFITQEIPSTTVTDVTLLNYLNIEKLDLNIEIFD
jgi:hypothetical protein